MRTIIASYAITNLACASLMALLWLQNRKRFAGIGFWLAQFIAVCVAVVLLALRGVAPDFLSIVVANALVIMGLIWLYIGLQRFVGVSVPQTLSIFLLAVFTPIHIYFTYVQPSLLARNINASVGIFVGSLQIIWFVFRKLDGATSAKLRGVGLVMVGYVLVSIARTSTDLLVDPGSDFLKSNSDSMVFLFYQTLQVTLTLSLFLQVNRRLVENLEEDILERQRAEAAVREREARYHQMFAGHPAIQVLVDPASGSIVEANPAAVHFYGYTADTLVQMNIQQINTLPPDEIAALRQGVKEGSIHYFSVPHRLASGEIRDVEVNSAPIVVNGRTLLFSIVHDITARKQAIEALAESEARYRAVTQSAGDAIISADERGKIIGWNHSAEVIFGYSEAEAMYQPLTLLMPADYREDHQAGMARVSSGGEKHLIGKTVEMHGQRKNGQVFPLEMSLAEWQVGGTPFYTAILRDVSERKQAEEALQQAQVRVMEQQLTLATLQEREHLGRELHDGLGQTLGYINAQAQAVQTLMDNQQYIAAQQNAETLVQAAQEAHANLRHHILGLHDSLAPQRDFYQALQAYLDSFQRAWGIETVLSLPPNERPVLPVAVENQLLHIVQEALVNIRKHAAARRVEVLITLQPAEMTVIISDNGQGFDPQAVPGVAQEHFGLNIMRERAGQVGGRLEVRSTIGHGSQVFVYIPYTFKPAAESKLKDMYSLRILLVDDQPLFLDGLRNLLKVRGLTVIGSARDGLEACEQVSALRPDVVLMDVQMPRCDGIEATRRIKAEFPETKVVLLTVSEDDENLLNAIQYGASSYLLKNLDANQLFATLDGLARDEIQLAPELAARLLKDFSRGGETARLAATQPSPAELTPRQWKVLNLVASGLTYKEAGRELHITEQAIKYHMAQILDRLQVKNREQAVAYLRQVEEARKKKDAH
jgi:PAS domain S-box-containing protein